MKDFFMSKLFLRVVYIIGAFAASHVVGLVGSPAVQAFLQKIGLALSVTDPQAFKVWITGSLLVAGEFVYHWWHEKFIIPNVAPQSIQSPQK